MTLYERYGRLMEERQVEHEAHLLTIAMLAAVVSGEIPAHRVRVEGETWTVVPAPLLKAVGSD